MSIESNVRALYLGSGDPALADYYPTWVDNLAADAILEGSLLRSSPAPHLASNSLPARCVVLSRRGSLPSPPGAWFNPA
jgi:hypothetical protein